ncbi:MAG: L-erythro-3,5-diaminohexanoate dehydrogenase [bacterium]|nr:L-erythro-3,5-diaminohexanoate dehydrogenase [bacterium]
MTTPALTVPTSPFGLHRVVSPEGVLPYSAEVLDATSPLRETEFRVAVEALNLDSASFVQLLEASGHDPDRLKEQVLAIVSARGKMQNPVTGSGGVLIGRVSEVGSARSDVAVGDRLVTLISLTTTPLALESLGRVHLATHQIEATGTATLFERSLFARIPEDLPESLVMSVLDVCGAPAQLARLAREGRTVVILGAGGKSGLLGTWVAAEQVGPTGQVIALVRSEDEARRLEGAPGPVTPLVQDCRDAVGVMEAVARLTAGRMADVVVNCVNVPHTEMSAILACKPRGQVYLFSMATSFQAAALGAESVGLDVDLLVGNGYAEGHAAFALDLVRRHPTLRERFEAFAST